MSKYLYVVVKRELEDYTPDSVTDIYEYNSPREAFGNVPEDEYDPYGNAEIIYYVEIRERD